MDTEIKRKTKIKRKNSKLINLSYVGSVLTYIIGLFLITAGHSWSFIFAVPTLILGLNLLKNGERKHGSILVAFFFVWVTVYYSYLPGQLLSQ